MTMIAFGIAALAAAAMSAVVGAAALLCLAEPSSPAEWDWKQSR
ncbi:hypothetical protein BH10PSE12_BH10PSE12_27220 [soil metagenome]